MPLRCHFLPVEQNLPNCAAETRIEPPTNPQKFRPKSTPREFCYIPTQIHPRVCCGVQRSVPGVLSSGHQVCIQCFKTDRSWTRKVRVAVLVHCAAFISVLHGAVLKTITSIIFGKIILLNAFLTDHGDRTNHQALIKHRVALTACVNLRWNVAQENEPDPRIMSVV